SAGKPQPEYDPRTLYERLEANRLKKEEEFAEKTKLGNLIKKLDEDEVAFLANQELDKLKHRADEQREIRESLELFRKAAAEKVTTHSVTTQADVPSLKTSTIVLPKSGNTVQKKLGALDGIIVRKRKGATEEGDKSNSDTVNADNNKFEEPNTPANSKKPRSDESKSSGSTQKVKQPKPIPAATPLALISGYDSGSESE
ncbi:hypothetical protein HDV05_002441, partial [Chytridiales sp. JEL 0842]